VTWRAARRSNGTYRTNCNVSPSP